MPELPEVEQVVRYLRVLAGREIKSCEKLSPLIFSGRQNPEKIRKSLAGLRVNEIQRRAKFTLFYLQNGAILIFHLGMTGQLFWKRRDEAVEAKHVHAVFDFADYKLYFRDVRRFGLVDYLENEALLDGYFSEFGPDALAVSETDFSGRLKKSRSRIKAALLNQKLISGLGNIYADESLFAAGIHPLKRCAGLTRLRLNRLHGEIRRILNLAIDQGGSSINDYVLPDGSRGGFQNSHRIYGRGGKPCVRCGTSIKKIQLGGRGTCYCARCQK